MCGWDTDCTRATWDNRWVLYGLEALPSTIGSPSTTASCSPVCREPPQNILISDFFQENCGRRLCPGPRAPVPESLASLFPAETANVGIFFDFALPRARRTVCGSADRRASRSATEQAEGAGREMTSRVGQPGGAHLDGAALRR
jgi:hypothetical protein